MKNSPSLGLAASPRRLCAHVMRADEHLKRLAQLLSVPNDGSHAAIEASNQTAKRHREAGRHDDVSGDSTPARAAI